MRNDLKQQISAQMPRTVICGCTKLTNMNLVMEITSNYGITRSSSMFDCHNDSNNPICNKCGEEMVVC